MVWLLLMSIGAGAMWGFGAALFSFGLFCAIDCSIDEAVERFTNKTRWK